MIYHMQIDEQSGWHIGKLSTPLCNWMPSTSSGDQYNHLPTITSKDPVALLPDASTAVHVTVVAWLPGKLESEAGKHITSGVGSTSSVAVAMYVMATGDALLRMMVSGSCKVGGVSSTQQARQHP
jgi:hypothetical protein